MIRLRISRPRSRRAIGVAAGLSALLIFFVVVAVWGLQTRNRVDGLSDHLERLQALTGPDLASGDVTALDALISELETVRPQLDDLRSSLGPARFAGSLIGWIPVIGGDIEAAPELADRALWDVDAALGVARAARSMSGTYGLIDGSFEDLRAAYAGGTVPSILEDAKSLLADADATLTKSEEAAAGSSAAGQGGRVGVYAAVLQDQEPRLREFIDWSSEAVKTADQLGGVVLAADRLFNLADFGGLAALGRAAEIDAMLQELTRSAAIARGHADQARELAPEEVRGATLERNVATLASALEGLEALGEGARIGLDAALPAVNLLAGSDAGLLNDGPLLLTAIDLLGEKSESLDRAARLLETGQTALGDAVQQRGQAKSDFLDRALDLASRLSSALVLAEKLPAIAPELLGADGPRTHLVLGQTSDELRATGGFVSGVWLMTFSGGALVSTRYIDVVEVDDLDNLALYPRPPRILEKYMTAPVWLLRDVTWDPDFPATAEIARSLFRLGQGTEVDGVIAITPWAFLKIADALGTIETSDGPLQADEVLPALELGTDTLGRQFMDNLFQGVISTVNGRAAQGQALDIAAAIERSLGEKNVLINLKDPSAQETLAEADWAGQLRRPALPAGRDILTVIDSNVGWSKVDRNIRRSTGYEIELHEDGPARSRLTLGYENVSGSGATGCTSQRMDRGSAYALLKNTCYWDFVRAFTHPRADLVSADRMPLPENSVAGLSGLAVTGDDTFELAPGPDTTVFGGLMTVPPSGSRSVTFVYDVPNTVVEWRGATATYFLELQVQPGTRGREMNVRVTLPDGFRYSASSMEPVDVSVKGIEFNFTLLRDTLLRVDLEKAEAG